MKKHALSLTGLACLLLISAQAVAQEAPAPRRMPRVPVAREVTLDHRDATPPSRQIQGPAAILDGERLRIADTDLRLFGIVPPQLAASFGPQARAALDQAAGGQSVTCQIRDRDRDGRLLATCQATSGNDMALELLKRGLAVTARGSLAGTDVATSYLAAEQAAQNQKLGLWSVALPASASLTATPAPAPIAATTAPAQPVKEEKKPAEAKPAPPVNATQNKIAAELIDEKAQARIDNAGWVQDDEVGFLERYQMLIAGLLMLATAISIIIAFWARDRREKNDETKTVAAALRGELMAIRSLCLGRAKSITTEDEDKNANWPRLRATLYGAYVGKVGLLGAELARLVAAIYGQSSDYAAYFTARDGSTQEASKKQALENLARHIDEVLPRLAAIEHTGHAPTVPLAPWHAEHAHILSGPAAGPVALPPAPKARLAPPPDDQAQLASAPATAPPPANAGLSAQAAAQMAAEKAARAPVVLWEAVRGFIQSHRNAIAQQPPAPIDPHVAEYAAMIEADMAQYQQGSEKKQRG